LVFVLLLALLQLRPKQQLLLVHPLTLRHRTSGGPSRKRRAA
jgi:hypothetical protein